MRSIFICYARQDREFARLAELMLKQADYSVWVDERNVRAGEEWRRSIDDGIDSSDVVLLVITPEACASKYVTYEWAYALGRGRNLIPLLLARSELHPRLESLQHLDFTNKKNMPWQRLYAEIDRVASSSRSGPRVSRVGDMTADQLRAMIEGAVSLSAAAAKSSGSVGDPDEISRVAQSVVNTMARRGERGETASAPGGTILWVDDRPDNNTYERRAFESMGLSFVLARSTNEALERIAKENFMGIISDMGRVEGPQEGYVLLDRLRAMGNTLPFFIYASSNHPEHRRQAAERGAQGCTSDPQELFDLVTQVVRA